MIFVAAIWSWNPWCQTRYRSHNLCFWKSRELNHLFEMIKLILSFCSPSWRSIILPQWFPFCNTWENFLLVVYDFPTPSFVALSWNSIAKKRNNSTQSLMQYSNTHTLLPEQELLVPQVLVGFHNTITSLEL